MKKEEILAAANATANAATGGTRSLRTNAAATPAAARTATGGSGGNRLSTPSNLPGLRRTATRTFHRRRSGDLLWSNVHRLRLHHGGTTKEKEEEGEGGSKEAQVRKKKEKSPAL